MPSNLYVENVYVSRKWPKSVVEIQKAKLFISTLI
jgi:hypothetical protein